MSKTIEIPEIAQYEETDSELAKYTIQKLSYENYRYKSYMENIEQVNKYLYKRIDKAIETLEKRIEENEEIDYVDMTGKSYINYQKEIIDILRGEDNVKD